MALSSDSELDEFVDALDETPDTSNVSQPSWPPRVESPVEQTDDVEEEEKRLLKLQKKAEERRKKEDEEIRKRWESVQKKKEEERVQQIQEEKWRTEEMARRRKLEQMRQRMLEESSSAKHGSSSSTDEDEGLFVDGSEHTPKQNQTHNVVAHQSIRKPDSEQQARTKPVSKDTDLRVSGTATPPNAKHDKLAETGPAEKKAPVLLLTTPPSAGKKSFPTETPADSHGSSHRDHGERSGHEETLRSANVSQGPGVIRPTPRILCKDSETEGAVGGTEVSGDTPVFVDSDLTPEEPDIVKSAKPRPPMPSMLLPPVAPPRRKKKRDDSSSGFSSEDRSSTNSDLLSPGLPPMVPTPTSTVESLTRELENSLDIQSAIGGRRHINAKDAEIGAVNSDHSSPVSETDQAGSDAASLKKQAPPSGSQENKEKTTGGGGTPDDPEPMGRPRSNSGRLLTDEEILEMVIVVNLDTGEKVPLNLAEDPCPKCVNPLSLHIMRRTQEYRSDSSLNKDQVMTDEEDVKSDSEKSTASLETSAKRKATRIKKFLGKTMVKTVSKVKSVADQSKKVLQGDDVEEEVSVDGKRFKFKACSHNKGPYDFQQFRILQDLGGEHTGAVWTMKFSPCGRLLATGGQDNILRIWVLKSACAYFEDLRHKYCDVKVSPCPSPAPSVESLNSQHSSESNSFTDGTGVSLSGVRGQGSWGALGGSFEEDKHVHVPFVRKPFCTYRGHSADLLDVSWSKNYFILSSSMDKTVRLWHISRRECLCTFQHIDFVTAIVFHPRDDRYFLSGSLDGKLRLWNIPDKKVTLWNEVSGPSNLITTANFCQNGKFAVVGTYDGKCIFYSTDQLKYYTQIHVRSTRGKNARGRKITGIEPMIGEDRVLVTSNDSRIRLYDLRDLTLTCKYKGCTNNSSQIKSSFSPKSKYIICGSEDHFIYIWKAHHELYKFSSARRDRNDFWEAIKVHNAVVTAAIFAPNPSLFSPTSEVSGFKQQTVQESFPGEIIVSVDFTGTIKVIQNTPTHNV
ncbi:LOW QUALITY PROTEIN: WD repeat-containing protein 44-like [Liolophura sinensis]|uniref:LOW QUALITY PROTEIN: WD repeat-containing protein 44-like n=1 Tax=Liolophura sinensis TaxID=3198878 RepID=UPI0031597491